MLRKIGWTLAGIILFAVFFLVGVSLTQTTPQLILTVTGLDDWEYYPAQATTIYYRDGEPMAEVGYQRTNVQDFPPFLKDAVVAVEDRRFYQHNGLDTKSIGRAIYINLLEGSKAQGGSTITQQLARTLFLTQEKTFTRKIKEVLLAVALEEKFTKDEILAMYLNEIYMGRGCAGFACAAKAYFNKDVWSLNQAEISLLVGLIQSPEHYNPETNWEGLKLRQDTVVNVLVEQGLLDAAQAEQIKNQQVTIADPPARQKPHPYLVNYVVWKMENMVGKERLYQGGMSIYTTIDRTMQNQAETALINNMRSIGWRGIKAQDGALISLDPATGAIRALVGGVDFSKNQLNMAMLPRQPGSAIKPLYYAAAVNEKLITSDTVINNKPRDFGGYQPTNSNTWAPDEVTVSEALARSYNVASVEILNRLGLDKAFQYLQDFGVTSLQEGDRHLALGLGGMQQGISPAELAAAYTAFPAQGVVHDYYVIEQVVDRNNKEIYTHKPTGRRVISKRTAQIMDKMLGEIVSWGTGTPAAIPIRSAGKTGTTTDSRDLWYVGYTNDLVTAVWIGNSDGSPVTGRGVSGGSLAAPVWRNYMSSLYYRGLLEQKPVRLPQQEPAQEPEDTEETETVQEPGEELNDEEQTGEEEIPEEEPVNPSLPTPEPGGETETDNNVEPGSTTDTQPEPNRLDSQSG